MQRDSKKLMIKIAKKHYVLCAIILLVALILDRFVKFLTVEFIKPVGSVPVINGVFNFTYRNNTGAAFSMFEGQRWLLIAVTSLVISILVYIIVSGRLKNIFAMYALTLIIAGGMGNLFDRIFTGYVVDTFDFCLINFAVFNVADTFVTCGTIAFLICYLVSKEGVFQWKLSQPEKKSE